MCLAPERGEGRAGRVDAEGNAFLHFSFFVPNPKSLGAHGSKIQRDAKSSVQGTHPTVRERKPELKARELVGWLRDLR